MNEHVLVIGGTGMLRDTTLWLLEKGYHVSVIGRTSMKHQQLQKQTLHKEKLHSIKLDYYNTPLLLQEIKKVIQQYGPISIVVCWIRSDAISSLKVICNIIQQTTDKQWKLYHIQSSTKFFKKETILVPDNCLYRSIFLGFILENNQSRWLTHDEISNGVIECIKNDPPESIVGTVTPWEKRPSY